ncbi:uncharacterized protein RB166_004494 [Leptodactylus fuscus]|uniref:uncharacterized protein LOC142198568 n=1 Tax=Leptodactylus fuscus TaxID=238119 RepID=UPI003F4E6BB3
MVEDETFQPLVECTWRRSLSTTASKNKTRLLRGDDETSGDSSQDLLSIEIRSLCLPSVFIDSNKRHRSGLVVGGSSGCDVTLAEKMTFLFRLTFLVIVLATEVFTQQTDFIVSSCRRSLIQLDLPAQNVLKQFVRFSAIDQDGAAYEVTDALATKCGYTIAYDDWGNIVFRSSLYSCYTQINDTYYTVSVKVEISSRRDMMGAVNYMKMVSCPYVWNPREIICEKNYMEVSVRRKIPVIAEGVFRDEPEDWSTAFTQAVSGLMSVWQVVFHMSTTQKTTMLIDAAQNIGYGINTTESRILLRSPYNATQSVLQRTGGVTFSTVRATLFYKQRWFIYLVDNAVACPVDDVKFVGGYIVWTVPKNISPLLTGARLIQTSVIQFGVDLLTLTNTDIASRKYEIVDSNAVTTTRIPVGAEGGYYKSHSVNFQYGMTYNIRPFLENLWVDDGWGITRYTIIKDITTPFEPQPPVITNETVPATLIFDIMVGPFLPDVQLVNLTIGNTTLTVPRATNLGYVVENITHPNGSVTFVLKVPFLNENVNKEALPDGVLFTLNITFGFNIIPSDETFTTTGVIESFIPQPTVGSCVHDNGVYSVLLGNLEPSWLIYIKDTLATPSSGLLTKVNQTFSLIKVPVASGLSVDEIFSTGVSATLPIDIRDRVGKRLYTIVVSCEAPRNMAVCLPEGIIQVTVKKTRNIPDMDMSSLTLRDLNCGPVSSDDNIAEFSFPINSCMTTRRFQDNLMIYDNEISYVSPVSGRIIYIMTVTCNYSTNGTLIVDFSPTENSPPSAQTGRAPLDLILRLSKDDGYNVFYEDTDYPVIKYLREPLYFEVELLYSTDPKLELFLDNCWATTTPDMGSFPTWPVIDNSCEHGEPYQTIFHPVTANTRVRYPSHLKRFEVKTFTFMDGDTVYAGEIYLHCEVIICDSSNLASDPTCTQIGSCIPARQRLGRSVDAKDKHRLVSSGAVFLLASKARAVAKQFKDHPQ